MYTQRSQKNSRHHSVARCARQLGVGDWSGTEAARSRFFGILLLFLAAHNLLKLSLVPGHKKLVLSVAN
jgi:hypothetical protein